MLWPIAVVLVIFWMFGLVTGYTIGYFIHIPLFFAIIAMLIQPYEEEVCEKERKEYIGAESLSSFQP
jgi:hypothetical protein